MRDVSLVASALIDAAELARMLSVSKPSIWRWKEAGKLPPAVTLTAQCVRWRRDAVLDWIEAGCPAAMSSESQKGTEPK